MEFDMVLAIAGQPGWLEFRIREPNPGGLRVLAKFTPSGNRALLTRLIIDAESGLDSQILRALPLGRVEAAANRSGSESGFFQVLPAEEREDLAARGEIFPEEFAQLDSALREYFTKSADVLTRSPSPEAGTTAHREPLTRPDGSDPEGFSKLLARAYNEAVVQSPTPAKLLAAEAGVPVTTVHRWIREARQRGALPPARKGRAG